MLHSHRIMLVNLKSGGLLLSLMIFSQLAQAIPLNYNLQLSLGSEDNSGSDPEIFKSIALEANYFKGLSRKSALILSGMITSIDFNDSSTRDGAIIEIEAKYSYIPNPGFTNPTYSIAIRQTEADNTDISTTALILTSSVRLDEEILLLGGLRFSESKSDQDDSQIGAFINIDYAPTNKLTLYATYSFVDSESDSMTTTVIVEDRTSRDPIAAHLCQERGDCPTIVVPGTDPTDFENTSITLGTSYNVAPQHYLDFAYIQTTSEPDDGDEITSDIFTANYYYLF